MQNTQEIVIVKPLPSKGRTQFGVYPNCRRWYSIGRNKLGKKVTGLTKEEADELGQKLNLDLSPESVFWNEFAVVMTNKERTFDLTDPAQKLEYLVLRSKRDIAESRDKIKPWSIYIMYNETLEAEKEVREFDNQLMAYKYLADMSSEEQSDFLKLFGYKTYNMKPVVIKRTLKAKAEKETDQFIKLYEDKDKTMRVLIEDLVQKKIFKIKNGAYYYGEDMMGADINLTLNNLKNPKKSDLLKALKLKNEETKI